MHIWDQQLNFSSWMWIHPNLSTNSTSSSNHLTPLNGYYDFYPKQSTHMNKRRDRKLFIINFKMKNCASKIIVKNIEVLYDKWKLHLHLHTYIVKKKKMLEFYAKTNKILQGVLFKKLRKLLNSAIFGTIS